MLRGSQVMLMTMLVWGNLSAASLPSDLSGGKDLQTISSWMAHLNFYYADLKVAPAKGVNVNNPAIRTLLMQDLQDLEIMMGRGVELPPDSLKRIACGRPSCNGGGGGGKCTSCEVDKD